MQGIRRIPGAGERAYAYAKACGIIGKSFLGKRMPRLAEAARLSDLDRMVFPTSSRDLPEKELLLDLEERIIHRAVNSIISIVECFSRPPELLTLLIRSYEYTDLKGALDASLQGDTAAPVHTDIGRFQTIRFDKWPDIKAMIEGTEFNFLLDKSGVLYKDIGGVPLHTILDQHYYSSLWKSLSSMAKKDRFAVEKILADEISLRNSSWALRLRTYYLMPPDEVKLHLIYASADGGGGEFLPPGAGKPSRKSKTRSLADEAVQCLEFPLDDFASWSSWRWKGFLNPDRGGIWRADPRYFQNAASRHLYNLARHYFRVHPFSLDTIFCFIKLKQFEEDILTSDAEGLDMGMSSRDVFSMLGVEA